MMNAHIEPGMAIVTGIEQGIYAEAVRSDHFEVTSSAPELASIWTDFSSPMVVETLRATAGSGSFFAHSAGVASYMRENYDVGG